MLLTAQHVLRPKAEEEGINAFYYLHGPYVWRGLPPAGIPDSNPGELMYQSLSVQPGGNRVRSFLDIVAPDETPSEEIRRSFMTFVSGNQRNPFPWVGVIGRCWFRANMELALTRIWYREIADLYHAATAARIGG